MGDPALRGASLRGASLRAPLLRGAFAGGALLQSAVGRASVARARIAMVATALSCAVVAPRAEAQSASAIIDSAAVAHSAFRVAPRADGAAAKLPYLVRAARAWPSQPSYWFNVARYAARASDTALVVEAVEALAAMSAGARLIDDTSVVRLSRLPAFSEPFARLARNVAPRASGRAAATVADSTVFAEGIDAHPTNGSLYVGSIRHRTVLEVRADGGVRDLHLERNPRIGAILGVRVASDGRTLYATTAGIVQMHGFVPADSTLSALVRVRIADGAIEERWDVPADGAHHLLGDLAITHDGTVLATDSDAAILFRLRPGARSLDAIRHPLFRSLQGIAPVPGSSRVIIADYSPGLLRVDLHAQVGSSRVERIVDAAGTTTLGINGLTWYDGAVIGVQNGIDPARVARFVLDAEQLRVNRIELLDRQPSVADEPTIGTLWPDGYVYVANSQWEKYDDKGRRVPGTVLRPTVLMFVPLAPATEARPF